MPLETSSPIDFYADKDPSDVALPIYSARDLCAKLTLVRGQEVKITTLTKWRQAIGIYSSAYRLYSESDFLRLSDLALAYAHGRTFAQYESLIKMLAANPSEDLLGLMTRLYGGLSSADKLSAGGQ